MVALQIDRDLGRAEVVVLAEVEDLAHDLGLGRMRANQWPMRPLPEALWAELLIAAQPAIVRMPGDPEVPARHRSVAANLLDVLNNGKASSSSPG